MRFQRTGILAALLVVTAGRCAGEIVDLSGSWRLNVKKSSWSAMRRPEMVILSIEHREPTLKLEGTVEHANEQTRHFAFSGAIDGKAYAAQRSFGTGTVTLKRVNDVTVTSTFRSSDGQYVETTEITIDRSRRRMTQRIHLTTPSGKRVWTEVYERRT